MAGCLRSKGLRCIVTAALAAGTALAAEVPETTLQSTGRAAPPEAGTVPAAEFLKDPATLAAWLKDHNREIQAAAARIGQAESELAQSRLFPNPTLSGSLSDIPSGVTNPPGLTFGETAIYNTALSETFELGKRGPRIRSARLRLQSERQSFLDALSQKIADARSILVRIAYLKARQSVLEESLGGARQILDLQRARMESGDLSGSDYDRLLVDTMVLESEVARTRTEFDETLASCRSIFFAPCSDSELDLPVLSAAAAVPDTPDLEAALQTRPDLRSVDLGSESARQDAILARHRAIPDPNLSVGYTRDHLTISGDQPTTYQVAVALPLPIFDRGQHDAARAEQHALELEQTANAGRTKARTEIEALLHRKSFLDSTLASLQGQAVPRSKSVLDATVTAVTQGETSMTDLLLARRTHVDLVLKVMDLQFDSFTVRNDLRRALGLDAEAARTVIGI